MNHISPAHEPRRIGPVEPDLLASAIFLFSEHLDSQTERYEAEIEAGAVDPYAEEAPTVDTSEVLDRFTEDLGTDVATTLNLYMRVTALFRLFSASPSLAHAAMDGEDGTLGQTALLAAARLDLYVRGDGAARAAEFDPREFRAALESD